MPSETNERPGAIEVRKAEATERKAIADALSDAFYDDPVMSWILPDDRSRRRRLRGLFGVLMRTHYIPLETVWTTPDNSGAALWGPPGHATIPTATILKSTHHMLRALGRRSLRALSALSHVEHLHPKEPHWYLGVLGTRPAHQGKGIGTTLLGPVLERCDDEGIPAYLESSKHSNIAFYNRSGFEVTGEIELPGEGPKVWPMWREPRAR